MKLLVMVALWTVMQAGLTTFPKALDSPTQTNSNEHTVGISNLPGVTVNPPRRDWADWSFWLFNFLLVAVAALQAMLLWRALRAVRHQAHEMTRQRVIIGKQLGAMAFQLAEMASQTTLLKEYVGHTETTAVAAKQSADAATNSVETFISKERARFRIVVAPFDPGISPATVFVKYNIHFHGHTDAFISQTAVYALISKSRVPEIDDERIKIFKIVLPDVIGPATLLTPQHMVHAYSDEIGLSFSLLLDAINNAKAFLHFYAFIKYRTLDSDRETRVCLTWNVNPATNAMLDTCVDNWEKSGPTEANRET
jgi:hypothetical protein